MIPSKGQIWRCKKNYTDVKGSDIRIDEDYYVYVLTDVFIIDKERIVRVCPVSENIDFKSDDDYLVENIDILGNPFIIELWNQQPVLVSLLDKYFGIVDIPDEVSERDINLDLQQLEFRKKEIEKAAYLNHSVVSRFFTKSQKKRIWYQISIAATILGFVFLLWQPFKYSSEQLFESSYSIPKPEVAVNRFADDTRGQTYKVAGFTETESNIVAQSIICYKERNYECVKSLLDRIDNILIKNKKVAFIQAVALFEVGDINESLEILEVISGDEQFDDSAEAKFYMALIYIHEKKEYKARKLLHELIAENTIYAEASKDLLRKIRWF